MLCDILRARAYFFFSVDIRMVSISSASVCTRSWLNSSSLVARMDRFIYLVVLSCQWLALLSDKRLPLRSTYRAWSCKLFDLRALSTLVLVFSILSGLMSIELFKLCIEGVLRILDCEYFLMVGGPDASSFSATLALKDFRWNSCASFAAYGLFMKSCQAVRLSRILSCGLFYESFRVFLYWSTSIFWLG